VCYCRVGEELGTVLHRKLLGVSLQRRQRNDWQLTVEMGQEENPCRTREVTAAHKLMEKNQQSGEH
jgi:hypothetical protein